MLAKSEYLEVLREFKTNTENMKLVWDRKNQTTFQLHNEGNKSNFNILLQRYEDVRSSKDSYLFTVNNISTKEIIISIDSTQDKDFYEVLFNLFSAISFNVEKGNISMLRDIISNLTV